MDKKILFDGDVLAYRCAWSENESTAEQAVLKLEELISSVIGEVDPWGTKSNRFFFLTGKGNFRNEIAKTAVYKGNRKDQPKPQHLALLREHMLLKYDAILSENCEADDMIGIFANRFGYDNVVIVSIDKDFEQIPTTIFNPSRWEWKTVDTWTATKNLYKQILMGDTVDNIVGIFRVGPVKAEKLLEGCDSEVALYNACVDAYDTGKYGGEIDTYFKAKERVHENAQLLYILREPDKMWTPPT